MTGPGHEGAPALLEAGTLEADPLLLRLFPALPTQVEWGLDRTRTLLALAGDPHLRFPTLHVGGTNGKGSVSATLASVLASSGLRVGLFTSPHLCSFAERIQVGGVPASPEALLEVAEELRPAFERVGPTFFEASTVLAFALFARAGVDVAVIEVGLGGRLDATNVLTPLVAAVTNVAMDHAEYLGDTLAAIAREKGGVAKPGIPFFTAEADPAIRAVLEEEARAAGATFHFVDAARDLLEVRTGLSGTTFVADTGGWGVRTLRTPLPGLHQAVNGLLAVRILDGLPPELRPSAEAIEAGLARVRWPGRVQVESVDGATWILDVAHNPAGSEALAELLARVELPRPVVVLTGILGDKDWRGMLPPILRGADRGILTQPPSAPSQRRWDPDQALTEIRAAGVALPLEVFPDFRQALARARSTAGGGTVVVTGSCHTVGDALLALDRLPWGSALAPPSAPDQIGAS